MRKNDFAVLAILLFVTAVHAGAQEASYQAHIRVDSQTLFTLRYGVGSIGLRERADVVNARLRNILNSRPATVNTGVKQTDIGWLVLVNDEPIVSATETDAQAERLSPRDLAERWAGAIQVGLERATKQRMRQTLWRRIAVTVLVVIIAIGALWGLRLGWRRIGRTLAARRGRIPSVRFRGLELLSKDRLGSGLKRALGFLYGLGTLLVVTTALLLVFGQFPATQEYARQVFFWIWNPLLDIVRGIVHYLPNLFYILVIIAVTRLVLRAVNFIFEQAHRGVISLEPWVHRDVARPTSQILRAIIVVLALFFVAPLVPGTGSTAAKGISVILGLMVSFGSTSTVGNLIAGIVLTYMRPFQLGDRVKLADTVGDVIEKTFLYTKVLTIKNEEVMVPSLQALSGSLVNYSAKGKEGKLILHTTVTIGYDASWRRVHELLLRAADKTTHILKEPQPFVLQTSLDDWYVSYQLNAYTDQPNKDGGDLRRTAPEYPGLVQRGWR